VKVFQGFATGYGLP